MNLQTDDNGFDYFGTPEDVKPEYTSVKCWSVLQFFTLDGKKTVIRAENIVPLEDLKYVVFSPQEKRYYLRESRKYSLNELYFYRRDLDFSGNSESIEQLKRYISDGNVHLLWTNGQISTMQNMLRRLWKSHFIGEKQLPYKSWIAILDQSLQLEDYREYGKSLTGFLTVCSNMERTINSIWQEAYESKQKG